MEAMADSKTQLNLKVPATLARELKLAAVDEGRWPAQIAADAIRSYLNRKARRRAKERPAPIAG